MKNTLTVLFLLFAFFASAQTPQRINYQGVARGADGAPVTDQDIGLRFDILQGSATGSVVFTEQQAIKTSSLGMILTQIGITGNLQTVNWLAGPFFLRVSVDFDGGTDFIELGTQQMMSVPFSLHAATVPGAYTPSTNILELGGNTFTLSSTPVTTLSPQGVVSLSNPATNSFVVSVPEPTFTPSGPVTITGAYPNLSVNSPSVPPTTTVDATGIASVSNAATNSFVIGVPEPTFTPSGPVTITGTYPNLSINSPSVPPTTTVGAVGIATVANAATNSFVVGVPQPTFTSSGPVAITGSYPNLTVTSPTVAPTASIAPSGAVSVTNSGVNSFIVGVPPTMVTVTGTAGVSGVSSIGTNSFNINIPAGVTPTITGGGAVNVAPANIGNNFTLTVPQTSVSLTQTVGATAISAAGTNSFNLNITPAVTPTITPFGVITRTAVGNSFSLTVPGTSLTQSGAAVVTSGGTNTFNVHVPQSTVTTSGAAAVTSAGTNSFNINVIPSSVAVTSTAGIVGITSPGTNSFNINVPPAITPTVTPFGVLTRTAVGSSFSLTVPGTSVTSTGAATVSTSGTNTFNINVPPSNVVVTSTPGVVGFNSPGTNSFNINVPPAITPTITPFGVLTRTAAGSSFSLTVPATSITSTGAATVTTSGTNSFNVNVPPAGVVVTSTPGVVGFNSTGTNSFNINVPPAITPTVTGTGLAITTATGNAFTVNVPVLTYAAATGVLSSGVNSVNINQTLSLAGTTLTSGPASNTVNLQTINQWRQAVGAVTLATASDRVGIGSNAPTENLEVASTVNTSVSILSGATNQSDLLFGTAANHSLGKLRFDNNTGRLSFWSGSNQNVELYGNGQLIIGNNVPFTSTTGITISRNGPFENQLVISGGDNNNMYGGMLSLAENLNYVAGMSLKLDAGGNRLVFTTDLAGLNPIMGIGGYSGANPGVGIGNGFAGSNPPSNGLIVQGNVGLGTSTPLRKLEVAANNVGIADNLGHTTLYHNAGNGNALFAESNNNGNSSVGGSTYARAMLAGINSNSPMGNVNSGVWGAVTGQGAGGYGVMASYGNFGLYSTYVGLAGSPYAGIFMGGNVGIGTLTPIAALQVAGNGFFSGNIGVQNTAPQANLELGTTFSLRLHSTPRLSSFRSVNYAPELYFDWGFGEIAYRTSNDNWSTAANEYIFGTNVPSGTASFRAGADNTKSLGALGVRWTVLHCVNGTINTSDVREKNSIRNLSYGLADVMKLRPVIFKWNHDPKNEDKIGLIAQEVQAVIGEVVKGGEDFGPKFITNEQGQQVPNPNYADRLGIFYSDLIPVVIKAMQEQQQIIEEQKSKLEALEARLNALERK